jgi:predicted transposase
MAVEYNINQFNSHKNIVIKEIWENKSKDKIRTQDLTEFDFNNAYISGTLNL